MLASKSNFRQRLARFFILNVAFKWKNDASPSLKINARCFFALVYVYLHEKFSFFLLAYIVVEAETLVCVFWHTNKNAEQKPRKKFNITTDLATE